MKIEKEMIENMIKSHQLHYKELELPEQTGWIRHAFETDDIWESILDERETKELELSRTYAENFAHGTAGHNRLMLIAKMGRLLDLYEDALHVFVAAVRTGEIK